MRLHILPLLFLSCFLRAQAPYTQANQYGWRVEKDLVYGTAVNYMGFTDTLKLDLYKPVGDGNTVRPLLVLLHGGAWVGGCKNDMAWLAQEMAGRGYAVAAVNYRLGWHKAFYVDNPAPNDDVRSLYAADSCEIIRAMYRGVQDVRGAIRWLKARHVQDSTARCALLVGGESAGGFLSLMTGFLDRPEEKPACCADLADAPQPYHLLLNRTTLDCKNRVWTVPPGSLARPDLGDLQGNLNLNGETSRPNGILSFYGGLPSEAFAQDWLQGPDTPALYLYHWTCDGVVPHQYGLPFYTLSEYCNLGFTPWHYNYPWVWGTGALAARLAAMTHPPAYQTDFLNCDPFFPPLALFECGRYSDNGSYHYVANRVLRAQKAADFFSPIVVEASADNSCAPPPSPTAAPDIRRGLRPAANPFDRTLDVWCDGEEIPASPLTFSLYDGAGRLIRQTELDLQPGMNRVFDTADLPGGWYVLSCAGEAGVAAWRVGKW